MDMNAFFGITLSLLVLRWWWKNRPPRAEPKPKPPSTFELKNDPEDEVRRAKEEARKQRERDVAELKRRGYTDELIATILPVIEDDQ